MGAVVAEEARAQAGVEQLGLGLLVLIGLGLVGLGRRSLGRALDRAGLNALGLGGFVSGLGLVGGVFGFVGGICDLVGLLRLGLLRLDVGRVLGLDRVGRGGGGRRRGGGEREAEQQDGEAGEGAVRVAQATGDQRQVGESTAERTGTDGVLRQRLVVFVVGPEPAAMRDGRGIASDARPRRTGRVGGPLGSLLFE